MQTDKTVLAVLRASLFTGEPVECSDWDAVYRELKMHAVAALAGNWLKKLGLGIERETGE